LLLLLQLFNLLKLFTLDARVVLKGQVERIRAQVDQGQSVSLFRQGILFVEIARELLQEELCLLEPFPLGFVALGLLMPGFLLQTQVIQLFLQLVKAYLGQHLLHDLLLAEHICHQTNDDRLIEPREVRLIVIILLLVLILIVSLPQIVSIAIRRARERSPHVGIRRAHLVLPDACLCPVLPHLEVVSLQHAARAIGTKKLAQVDAIDLIVEIIYINLLTLLLEALRSNVSIG
jgi:hypothetical protein